MFPSLLAALTVLATVPYPTKDGLPKDRLYVDPPPPAVTIGQNDAEPSVAVVSPGDAAPNFSYVGADGRGGRLRDLLAQGAVLLVFDPNDDGLAVLQRERDRLVDLGVVPVAVTDLKAGGVRAVTRRLGLTYPVIPDPRAIAASQFNTLDPGSLRPLPAWFVLDRGGRVRALGRGAYPSRRWAEIAANALGLPTADTPHPASHPR